MKMQLPLKSLACSAILAVSATVHCSAHAQALIFGFEQAEGYNGANQSSIAGQGGWTGGGTAFTLNTTKGYQSSQSLDGPVPTGSAGRTDSPDLLSHNLGALSLRFTNPEASFKAGLGLARFRIVTGTDDQIGDPLLLRRLEFGIAYASSGDALNLTYNVHSDSASDKRGSASKSLGSSLIDLTVWNEFRFEADFDDPSGPVYSVYINGTLVLDRVAIYDSPDSDSRIHQLQFWSHAANGAQGATTVSYDQIMGTVYSPVPEPATAALAIAGGVLFLLVTRQRQ